MLKQKKTILIVAGEVSGDMHAAELVKNIKEKAPFELEFFGVGGEALRAQGVKTFYDVSQTGVVGFIEVIKRIGFFRRMFKDMLRLISEKKPDILLLVDYPGFNLKLAQVAKKRSGVKIVYYISPQVWAWRSSRRFKMARYIDRLLTIFPFEPEIFRGTSLKTDFVGHPLVEKFKALRVSPREILPWQVDEKEKETIKIALLPGSRRDEIKKILPVMLEAAALILKNYPQASFLVAAANDEAFRMIEEVITKQSSNFKNLMVLSGKTREILLQARAAIVASGTATIESALAKCPMVVVYKVAPLTFFVGRMFVKVPFLGMVNLVAGKAVAPECLQSDAEPYKIVEAVKPLLEDNEYCRSILTELDEVEEKLSGKNAVSAAEVVIKELKTY
jgi:lipid-A-disaccharide synthase